MQYVYIVIHLVYDKQSNLAVYMYEEDAYEFVRFLGAGEPVTFNSDDLFVETIKIS